MTDYSVLKFLDHSITIGSGGTSEYIEFFYDWDMVREDVSASTNVSWLAIDDVDMENSRMEVTFEENSGTQRTGKIYIKTRVLYPGESSYSIVDDNITVIQIGNTGTGFITVSGGTEDDIEANGGSGTIGFTLTNCEATTLSVSPDNNWEGNFTIGNVTTTGFTWSANKNETGQARSTRVQISAKMSDSDAYAYAYVGFVQPDINDVGYILFEANTLNVPYTGFNSGVTFVCPHISAITSADTTEIYWQESGLTWDVEDVGDDMYEGEINFKISPNPYNFSRTAILDIYGTSLVDGSRIDGILYIEQAANPTGITQYGYIETTSPTITLDMPDETCVWFNLTLSNINPNYLQVKGIGNFQTGYPQKTGAGGTVINCCMKATTSTTEWTTSTIYVYGGDTVGGSSHPVTTILNIQQPPFVEKIVFPIWRDEDVRIDSLNEYVDYIITTGDTTIYSGRAYTLGGSCTIRLNTILQDFLRPQLNVTVEGIQDKGCYLDAMMKVSEGGEYRDFKRIKCFYDWSYKTWYSNIMSKPLSKTLDKRQLLLCTLRNNDGEMLGVDADIRKGGSYLYNLYDTPNDIGTIVLGVYDVNEVTVIAAGDEITYKIEDTCKRYCLYYLNAAGGWDSYLFENTSKESDAFTRSTYKRNINNQTHQFSKVEYRNKIVKSWTLKTGYMSDAQSLNLAENLMGTTQAYLHDLEDGKIYPVVVTSKKSDYLTYKRNGRKMVRYDVNVELAQDRQRR